MSGNDEHTQHLHFGFHTWSQASLEKRLVLGQKGKVQSESGTSDTRNKGTTKGYLRSCQKGLGTELEGSH